MPTGPVADGCTAVGCSGAVGTGTRAGLLVGDAEPLMVGRGISGIGLSDGAGVELGMGGGDSVGGWVACGCTVVTGAAGMITPACCLIGW